MNANETLTFDQVAAVFATSEAPAGAEAVLV